MRIFDNDIFSDVHDAYLRWRALMNAPSNRNSARRFWRFLGVPEETSVRDLPPEALHRVAWMNSPHYVAMFRAWEAQNAKTDS